MLAQRSAFLRTHGGPFSLACGNAVRFQALRCFVSRTHSDTTREVPPPPPLDPRDSVASARALLHCARTSRMQALIPAPFSVCRVRQDLRCVLSVGLGGARVRIAAHAVVCWPAAFPRKGVVNAVPMSHASLLRCVYLGPDSQQAQLMQLDAPAMAWHAGRPPAAAGMWRPAASLTATGERRASRCRRSRQLRRPAAAVPARQWRRRQRLARRAWRR